MRLTAQDLKELGIIDEIVAEPLGGAHRNKEQAIDNLRQVLRKSLQELSGVNYDKLKKQRTEKFMKIGTQFIVPQEKKKSNKR